MKVSVFGLGYVDALRTSVKRHTLVFRSTMLPGSTGELVGTCFDDLEAGGHSTRGSAGDVETARNESGRLIL